MSFFAGLINWSRDTFLPFGGLGLFFVAFAEAIFFPVPPDLILIPLALLRPELALWYALVCTFGSTLGALTAHYIGRKKGRKVLKKLISEDKIRRIDKSFEKHGVFAVGAAAFSPIPFQVFALASGVFKLNPLKTAVIVFLGRGARFFSIAFMIMFFGEQIMSLMTSYFEIITFSVLLIAIIFYWLYRRRKTQ